MQDATAAANTGRYPSDFQCVLVGEGSFSTFRVGRVSLDGDEVLVSDDDVTARYPRELVGEVWPVGGQRIDPFQRPAKPPSNKRPFMQRKA